MSKLKISIITAVYNRVDTLQSAIDSVHRQTYENIEHVLVDGNSTDGSRELLAQLHRSSDQFSSEPDEGIYDALNKGMKMATGDVLGLMHSDDFFADDNVIADIAQRFADPNTMAVYGDLQYVSKIDSSRVVRNWISGPYKHSKLKLGWMPPHPTLFLRREVIEQFGGYNTNLRIAADYDAMLRYLSQGIVPIYIPRVLVKMRVGGESNKSLKKILTKSKEDLWALKHNGVGGLGTLMMKNASKIKQFF